MQYSTSRIERELDANGVEFDRDSVYDRFCQLTDTRKAKGKRYRLETVLMIIVLAKLCGCDRPMDIAEWASNHRDQLVKLLCLERTTLPHYNTYRRIMAHGVYQEEIESVVGRYNQDGPHGKVYALDGKAIRGMRKKDEEGNEYMLSVYDVEQAKVMSQETRSPRLPKP